MVYPWEIGASIEAPGCYTSAMAKPRPAVPTKLKQQLIDEAGGKCVNPGCPSYRTHLHHIEEWAVYETHDGKTMIAICPTCHDAVHNGPLVITDETLYRWKQIERSKPPRDHFYVEPGQSPKLLLGTISVTGQRGVIVFDLGKSTKLSFRLEDEDVMLLNLAVSTTARHEVLRIVDGHVRRDAEEPVRYERVPGRVRVTAPACDEFMPAWAIQQLRVDEPTFAENGDLPLLDIEVLEPGLVRVQGIWNSAQHVIAVTLRELAFLDPRRQRPIALAGSGAGSVLQWNGPITESLFSVGGGTDALRMPSASEPRIGRNDLCWCGSGKKFKKCHGG